MTRDYSKGFIYKLCCKDVNVKEIYVGSSTNMKQRKNGHKNTCNNITYQRHNLKVYQYIRENGGWSNWSMIWIKDYPCNSRRELEAEEDKIMRELNATLNTNDPVRNKEKRKEWCKEYNKKWREKNKEILKQKKQVYVNKNKEELNRKRAVKIICECGCEIRKGDLSRHRKSKKHQSLISSNI
tara:strand:+ start:293 stop:841 length:549 start_codon:yes stop_codon:yes gene_type:complete